MVSPTLADFNSLMPAMTKPTSPAFRFGRWTDLGVNTPTCSHRCSAPVAMNLILSGLQRTINHAHQHHHADVVVEPGVDDQRLERAVGLAHRRRHLGDNFFQNVLDADAGLGRGAHRVRRLDADNIFDFLADALRLGGRQVDLVQHRHHFHAQLDGGVAVGHGLRFHALRGVHHQQRAFAGGQRARHFIGKVHVSGVSIRFRL